MGNVIIDHVTAGTTPQLVDIPDWYDTIPPQPLVFEGLRLLNRMFGGNVTLVYNAKDTADRKILDWLQSRKLTEMTGIPLSRIFRTTHGRDKTPFMSQESATHYGTTVVIDDRLEVHRYFMDTEATRLFLFQPQLDREIKELKKKGIWDFVRPVQEAVRKVDSWSEVIKALHE